MSSTFISIQGNIGSGKSTILKIIKQNFPELTILDEPLASWQKVGPQGNVNLLKRYYTDPKRWGFTFQIYAFMSRLTKWTEFNQLKCQKVKVSERSLLSDRYIFAKIMRDMDILCELEHQAYLSCYEDLTKMQNISKVKGVIYVQCDPKTCSERIKSRAREGEGEIPLDYLEKLHEKHEEWLNPNYKMNNEETQSSGSDQSEESNEVVVSTQEQTKKEVTNCSTSILDQEVLIIDNRIPINKNRMIMEIRQWLNKFN